MHLSELVDAFASTLDASAGRFETLARRLQEAGMLPKSEGGSHRPRVDINDAVLLLVAHLCGAEGGKVAAASRSIINYTSDSDTSAGEMIAGMLTALVRLDELGGAVVKSSVSIADGSRPAVIIRMAQPSDGAEPLELTYTPDAEEWRPWQASGLFRTHVLPGVLMFRVARALADLFPRQLERRTFPFEVS